MRSGLILIVSSIGGVLAGVGSGPYTMSKHAIQALGTTLRAELAPFAVDVAPFDPGPYATGFNDRMANDGPRFNRKTAAPEDIPAMDSVVKTITVGQMNPTEGVKRNIELVEADKTALVNFVPPDIGERIRRPRPA